MLPAFLLAAVFLAPQATDHTIPQDARVLQTAEATGVQIYRCAQKDAAYAWVFQSPEAVLSDPATHEKTGTHGAGPTWTWKDGSSIAGKVIQILPSPEAGSIPWLLLETKPSGTATGMLTPVTHVWRSDTHGGQPPSSGCDVTHAGDTLRVPYTAHYTFYIPATPARP